MESINKYIKAIISFFIVFLFIGASHSFVSAQTYDQDLAMQYMNAKEYDKAAILWEQLYEKYKFKTYMTNYIKCLKELNELDKAEKFLKKEIKNNSKDPSLYIDIGMIYSSKGDTQEANKQFDKAIKLSIDNKQITNNTANYLLVNRLYDQAEILYKTAATEQKISYDFELANLYYFQRDYMKMTDKYLDLLFTMPEYLSIVENRYQFIMSNNSEDDFLETLEISLIQKIQKYPQKTVYSEFIIWLFIQTGRYEDAFTQIISIDKKTNANGDKVIDFGQMLSDNNEYNLALAAFDYVLNLGESNHNYQIASVLYLNELYKKIINTPTRTNEELVKLEQMLEANLVKVRTKQSFSLIYALANIKAFYLNKTQEAANFLKNVIDGNKLAENEISECKLLYGDILLFDNNPWDATLIYAQVEKANPNNPYGHEAKFRKAKLAYYTGQFQWAQAQLDILKAGTSKLIANDAFELSFFINENSALDTTYEALSMFARADLLLYKHKETDALITLDSILNKFPGHEILDDVYFRKGKIYESLGKYPLAIEAYSTIVKTYSYDILADNALYKLATLYDYILKDKNKAMEAYQQLLSDYPSSIFVVEARKRFRFLRGERFQEGANSEQNSYQNSVK